jgi:hypothetical protein
MSVRTSLGWAVIVLALTAFLTITARYNFTINGAEHFSRLAQSFLHGRLYFDTPPDGTWKDTTPYDGKNYWPLGPFPAVLLMPFQFLAGRFGIFFYQGYLQIVLVILLLALVFLVARRTGFGAEDASYLAFGFVFSTACLGVALWPWSWYLSQVITCILVFAAIAEMTGKRRPIVIGIFFALCFATRAPAALGLCWFIGETLCRNEPKKWRTLTASMVPCLIVLGLLLLYNYARFGNVLEQGYANQIIPEHAAIRRNIGIFSIQHLPANLYVLLLAGPLPITRDASALVLRFPFVAANPWGMSLFVTAPCFFMLSAIAYRDITSRLILITTLLIALPVLFYYGIGYRQFGYRYSLDFLPLLYYLLFRNYRLQREGLTTGFKVLIILSAVWNLHLFAGYYIWQVMT